MANQRAASRKEWRSGDTVEDINSGSFQRIADAVEKMAGSYQTIIDERDYYKRFYEERGQTIANLSRQIAGLRGAIKRMKKAKKG